MTSRTATGGCPSPPITLRPQKTWSWTLGQVYLRDDLSGSPTALGRAKTSSPAPSSFASTRTGVCGPSHCFDARTGTLREQDYAIYRDLRSWTAALTFRFRNSPGTPGRLHRRRHLLAQGLSQDRPRPRSRPALLRHRPLLLLKLEPSPLRALVVQLSCLPRRRARWNQLSILSTINSFRPRRPTRE